MMRPESPLRILRIIARLNVGGPSIQAISLSSELSSDGFRTLLVCGQVGSKEADMGYLAREKGVTPLLIPELGREISILDDFKALLALRRIIKRFKPDIIHTHTAKAGTLGRLAGASVNFARLPSKRIKLVHTFHGHVFHSYFSHAKAMLFVLIEKFLAGLTDRIIVISALQKRDICRRYRIAGEKKVSVVPLGFDLSDFYMSDERKGEARRAYLKSGESEIFLVGIVGRLTAVKNHSLLLNSFKILKEWGKLNLFKCIIVGGGELEEELKGEAEGLSIGNSVLFAGWIKDMSALYPAFDVLALTSKNEGTPVTIIEAMASSVPVAATDVGGTRDLLGGSGVETGKGFLIAGNGILVRPGDPEAMAHAFLFLRENKDIAARLAENSKKYVQKYYSFERLLNDIKSVYLNLAESHISP